MKKSAIIRLLALMLALIMVLPVLPIFAEESNGTTAVAGDDSSSTNESADASEGASDDGSEDASNPSEEGTQTPGETPTPDSDLPAYDEGFESIPDSFEFDDDLFYLAYKNTTTYSLVRSEKAMILVKAYMLELQQTFMKLTAEDPEIVLGLTPDQQEEYGSRMGANFPLVEDASHLTKNEIIIGQYDWDTQKDLIGRSDVSKMAKELITGASDFFIHVTDDGDVWVVGGANTTTVVAFDFLIDRILKIDYEQRYIAIKKGFTYVYHHEERNDVPFAINNKGENAFEFSLQAYSMSTDVFCRLTYNGSNGWRLQDKQVYSADYNDLGAAQLLSATIGEDVTCVAEKLTYKEEGKLLTITAPDGSYAVVDTTTGTIEFYTKSGKLAQKLLGATHTVYHGTHTVTARFAIAKNDVIYGSGGQFTNLNLNGQLLTLYTNDIVENANNVSSIYTVIPFFVNTKGSAVFMNRNEYMTVDIGKSVASEMTFSVTNGTLDCYVFTTESINDAITEYSNISGFADVPADWSYGMLVCRYNKEFAKLEGVYEMIAKMEQYGLAWTGVILEDWNPYNSVAHAELKKLCDYLHSLGKKVIVYVQSGALADTYENTKYLVNYKGFNANTLATRVPSNVTGEYLDEKDHAILQTAVQNFYLDLTNPSAVKWFFDEYWTMLLNDVGVDGAKIDMGGLMVDTVGTLYFYDANMATAGAHHWYASAFNALLWEAISSKPDSGICYINSAGIGAQRAPYMWAGDQTRVKNRLQRQLNYVLTAGLSGIPFVSYDMGTAAYKDNEKMDIKEDAEYFLRALEMTVFMPSMQTSGTVRRPYDFAEENEKYAYVTQLYKLYTKLHESLVPYFQELSEIAATTGIGPVRHLVLNYANDANVYGIKNQYMLGDAFLVAPEIELKSKRDIYLPEGKWLDLNTGDEIVVPAGGQTIEEYKVDDGQIAVFYNMNTTSTVAAEVLSSVRTAIDAINKVDY